MNFKNNTYKAKKYNNPEDQELIKFFQYVRWKENGDGKYGLIYHTANERRCSYAAGKKLKAKGVKSGIPDISCMIPSHSYHALFIELKIKPNTLSDTQENMGKLLTQQGYKFIVCYSADEAISVLDNYLNTK